MRDESWVMRDMREKMMNDEWCDAKKNFCWNKSFWPSRTCSKTLCSMHGLHSASFFDLSLDHATGSCTVGTVCKGIFWANSGLKNKKQNVKATTWTILVIQPSIQKRNVNISCQPLPSRLSHQCNVDWLQKLVACTWTCVPHAFKKIYIAYTAKNPPKTTIVPNYLTNIHSAHIIQTMSMWSGMSTHWLCCPVLHPSFPLQPANNFCRRMMLQSDTQGSASLSSLNPSANIRGVSTRLLPFVFIN